MSRMFRSTPQPNASHTLLELQLQKQRNDLNDLYTSLDPSGRHRVTVKHIEAELASYGLDPHKEEFQSLIHQLGTHTNGVVSFDEFFELMSTDNPISHALLGKLSIPNFREFCQQMVDIIEEIRPIKDGKNADYIPMLANENSELLGLSLVTVDGQRFSYGDFDHEFSIQSCSKPFTYALACEDEGPETVHRHVGTEPSGVAFNAFTLNENNIPHNPMINAGAITTCSLVRSHYPASARFAHLMRAFSDMAGSVPVGFSQPVFLSERDTADRKFCTCTLHGSA